MTVQELSDKQVILVTDIDYEKEAKRPWQKYMFCQADVQCGDIVQFMDYDGRKYKGVIIAIHKSMLDVPCIKNVLKHTFQNSIEKLAESTVDEHHLVKVYDRKLYEEYREVLKTKEDNEYTIDSNLANIYNSLREQITGENGDGILMKIAEALGYGDMLSSIEKIMEIKRNMLKLELDVTIAEQKMEIFSRKIEGEA